MTNYLKRAILSLVVTILTSSLSAQELRPVEDFDIERYQGKWHQMAAIPASVQEDCVANATTEYSITEKTTVRVVNSCLQKDGKRKVSEARARINPDWNVSSILELTSVMIFDWLWLFSGDYWVIDINPDYNIALVGNPNYEFGWILSRSASISRGEYSRLKKVLIDHGYDPCSFLLSNTPEQSVDGQTSLCAI